jgi:hypothetical protein
MNLRTRLDALELAAHRSVAPTIAGYDLSRLSTGELRWLRARGDQWQAGTLSEADAAEAARLMARARTPKWDLSRLTDAELDWLEIHHEAGEAGTLEGAGAAEWSRLEKKCTGGPAL